jgi:hypothetical protein
VSTYRQRISVVAVTSCLGSGIELDRSIAALSSYRRRYELAHELGHLTLECHGPNQSGMSSIFECLRWLSSEQGLFAEDRLALPSMDVAPVNAMSPLALLPPRTIASRQPALVQRAGRINRSSHTIQVLFRESSPLAERWAAFVGLIDNLLSVFRCMKALLRAAVPLHPDVLAFVLVMLAACRRYGHRSEPDDHGSLLIQRHLVSIGSYMHA